MTPLLLRQPAPWQLVVLMDIDGNGDGMGTPSHQANAVPVHVVVESRPQTEQEMLVACLWSRWAAPGEPDLLSYGAITDEPPPDVAAAGHDRCIVPIQPDNIDAWLSPEPKDLAAQQAILEDRARPYYEHRLGA